MLAFIYRSAAGNESERTLTHWIENSRYIQGRTADDTLPKTYRKDRIVQILQGQELLQDDLPPFVPAPTAAAKAATDQRAQILFTGFPKAQRAELEALADSHGLRVMKTASKALAFLCCGPNAGPTKVIKAHEAGAFLVSAEELHALLATGELPES